MTSESLSGSVRAIGLSVIGVAGCIVLLVRLAVGGDLNMPAFTAFASLLGVDALRAGAPKL